MPPDSMSGSDERLTKRPEDVGPVVVAGQVVAELHPHPHLQVQIGVDDGLLLPTTGPTNTRVSGATIAEPPEMSWQG
ncbi:MAG: hypothetical protein ACRDVM_09820 [Acidimicrobiia bacterium]